MPDEMQQQTNRITERVGRHRVREEIQRRILSGERKPGERLSQQSLARELGVTQGTVRESLMDLQRMGLVDSVDQLGVFVGTLDLARVGEAYQVREILEGLSARLCCGHAGRSDIETLREMASEIRATAKKRRPREAAALDRAFHFRIIELSRNRILLRLAEMYQVLGMIIPAGRDSDLVDKEHLGIVDAIEQNLTSEAEHLAREHVAGAIQVIRRWAQQGKFTPERMA